MSQNEFKHGPHVEPDYNATSSRVLQDAWEDVIVHQGDNAIQTLFQLIDTDSDGLVNETQVSIALEKILGLDYFLELKEMNEDEVSEFSEIREMRDEFVITIMADNIQVDLQTFTSAIQIIKEMD